MQGYGTRMLRREAIREVSSPMHRSCLVGVDLLAAADVSCSAMSSRPQFHHFLRATRYPSLEGCMKHHASILHASQELQRLPGERFNLQPCPWTHKVARGSILRIR